MKQGYIKQLEVTRGHNEEQIVPQYGRKFVMADKSLLQIREISLDSMVESSNKQTN